MRPLKLKISAFGPYAGEETVNFDDLCKKGSKGGLYLITGNTGAGKSTIVNLVSRFYDVKDGSLLIDGKDIRDVTLESLRRNISQVLQDTFLFNGTIAENIGYAVPDASLREIEEAAKAASFPDSPPRLAEQG